MRLQRYELACDVDDGIEALEYWRGRRARLAWHRRADRREADLMTDNWERRLRAAVLRDPRLSISERAHAGVAVVRTNASIAGRRWKRRAQVTAVGMAAVTGAGLAAVAGLF
ncbi:MAG: hypothetical protein QOJ12_1522 [Thermoleophilales bacterium]|jgi:hypothetical protein|nr:hypothetical protein [Thermoleophilales bacterium]